MRPNKITKNGPIKLFGGGGHYGNTVLVKYLNILRLCNLILCDHVKNIVIFHFSFAVVKEYFWS